MRVRPQRGKFAAERNDFGQSRRAAGVGDVSLLRRVYHVAAAPQVMKSVVHANDANAEFIGELHAGLHRVIGDGLAEFFLRIPDAGSLEPDRNLANLRAGHAAAGAAAVQMIEVQRLDAVMRADTVRGRRGAETRRVGRFIRGVTAMPIGLLDQRIVDRLRNNVISLAHRFFKPKSRTSKFETNSNSEFLNIQGSLALAVYCPENIH